MRALFGGAFSGRRVFLTGHTGFKGSWLSLWLSQMGAEVTGFSLDPPTTPSLFAEAKVAGRVRDLRGDVRDRAALDLALREAAPEFVFHLAAQPLVRLSYDLPAETFDVNVMGTVRLLEAVRGSPSVRACVVVTSDKCYENREWEYSYRENDPVGGHDPYSASKGAAEVAVAAWRRSFFAGTGRPGVASARAGNVIGGGDWAADRLLPDCVRALARGEAVALRNPAAVRPWQFVLEPLSGYLWLAALLAESPGELSGAWNFGPRPEDALPVGALARRAAELWGGGRVEEASASGSPRHEAGILRLDWTRAATLLGWEPVYPLSEALAATVRWHLAREKGEADLGGLCLRQIGEYAGAARSRGLAWATEGAR